MQIFICLHLKFHFYFQKEDKIRFLRQRLIERGGDNISTKSLTNQTNADAQPTNTKNVSITQGKDSLFVQPTDHTIASDFDSAIGGGISVYTRSSRASQSDFEFSESYL